MEQLKGKELGERLLIPSNMLRAGERVFLDDVALDDLERELGVPVTVVEAESGFDLVDAMLELDAGDGGDGVEWVMPEDGEYYVYNPPAGR